MALWNVEPTCKKSIVEKNYWTKGDKRICVETGWRWGEFTIETEGDEQPEIDEDTDLMCADFELGDWSTTDGCWEDRDYDNMSEREINDIEIFLEDNSVFDLEDDGWSCTDSELYITCDVTITKVEDEKSN
jgi:hypothetical protein